MYRHRAEGACRIPFEREWGGVQVLRGLFLLLRWPSFGIFVECDAEALSVNLECESTEYGSSIENPCPYALLVFSIRAKTLRNVPLDYFQAQKCLSVGRMGRTLVKLTLLFIREGAKPDSAAGMLAPFIRASVPRLAISFDWNCTTLVGLQSHREIVVSLKLLWSGRLMKDTLNTP